MKDIFDNKQSAEQQAFNAKQMHVFRRRNRTFAIDLQSLLLYELIDSSHWFRRRGRYLPISIVTEKHRMLDGEGKQTISKQQEAGIYCYMNISHSCNMSCQYCFAKQGMYGGPEELMDLSIAKETVDWLCRSSKGREVSINFFGGEPLFNSKVLYETIAYAKSQTSHRDKSLRVRVSTNGTIDLCALGVALTGVRHNIAVSVDGPPSVQDKNRPLRSGRPSYEKIAKHVCKYIERFGVDHISAKATWRRGQTNLVEVAQSLLALGFVDISICRESAFGGGTVEPQNRGAKRDFDEILYAYDGLLDWYIEQLNTELTIIVEPLATTMRAILESRITKSRCPVGISSFCITPQGDVYPCHRFVGNESYVLGNICNPDLELIVPPVCEAVMPLPRNCTDCWAKSWCFSDNCVYLSAIGKDLRLLKGYCKHIQEFLEIICYHLSDLTEEGRRRFFASQNTTRN